MQAKAFKTWCTTPGSKTQTTFNDNNRETTSKTQQSRQLTQKPTPKHAIKCQPKSNSTIDHIEDNNSLVSRNQKLPFAGRNVPDIYKEKICELTDLSETKRKKLSVRACTTSRTQLDRPKCFPKTLQCFQN